MNNINNMNNIGSIDKKNKSSKKPYTLTVLLLASTLLFSALGQYWNVTYYQNRNAFSFSNPPLATAMQGLHDGAYLDNIYAAESYQVQNLILPFPSVFHSAESVQAMAAALIPSGSSKERVSVPYDLARMDKRTSVYAFTTAEEGYFDDACFIGDSRTVGISEYAGMEGATFLCRPSFSIFDYDKPKISYENKKTSVYDVLLEKEFGKIYLMVGINECGIGTPETFFKRYQEVVENIREIQPDALIFLQANLMVTEAKSQSEQVITNENIAARNELIATLANQKDIFYIDINESSLCEDGALIPDYTWDQVHIKAQYYTVWKEFLLQHAVLIPEEPEMEIEQGV